MNDIIKACVVTHDNFIIGTNLSLGTPVEIGFDVDAWMSDDFTPLYILDGETVREATDEERQAWREAHTQTPAPSIEDRLASAEEQLLTADETAVELYEAFLEQSEINLAQDEALVEIFEMFGN